MVMTQLFEATIPNFFSLLKQCNHCHYQQCDCMKTLSHFPVDSLQSKAAEGEILAQVEIGVLKQIKPQLLLVLFTPAIQN